MICSVLIPTRGRPIRLKETIRSLFDTARSEDFEVRLRVDDDDEETIHALKDIHPYTQNIHAIIGPRGKGYLDLNNFYTALADASVAPWIWIFNDDVIVESSGWADELKTVPREGFIVQPEFNKLNNSTYRFDPTSPFPIAPNGCWRQFGYDPIPDPADMWLDKILRLQNGWKTHFLSGLTTYHERKLDATLTPDRL